MQKIDPKQKSLFLVAKIAGELSLSATQINSTIELLEGGNTVPFIARYRKEATGDLDEVQIRSIEERRLYLLELESRRETILSSIESQGKLSDELRAKILACEAKNTLEDLYLPYKPKRRTRAMIAREKGLEPLALRILEQPSVGDAEAEAAAFVNVEKEVADVAAALQGARDIVAEVISERADVRAMTRETLNASGLIASKVRSDVKVPTKFEQYYDFKERIATIPSHRFLAILRGEREDVLRVEIEVESEGLLHKIAVAMQHRPGTPFAAQLKLAVDDAYKRLIAPTVETDIRVDLKLKSDKDAVDIFAQNLRSILLSAPLGGKAVIGIDPGLRTGCKCAVVNETGKFIDNVTIYLSQGDNAAKSARATLLALVNKYNPIAIAVGNGTGGRETEAFVRQLLASENKKDIIVVAVSESGASVYSASEVAREEFPDLDLTIRGAISIARRLQDPLAELVKVEPKALGVGQYQHDVFQPLLDRKLGEVVESCVNQVGVELNTASAPLLAHVAGIGPSIAKNIVAYREKEGSFSSRKELLKVSGLGNRTFEQAAGFLRIRGAKNPLDASAVHPERYALVEKIAADAGISLTELVGNAQKVSNIDVEKYRGGDIGALTLRDIIDELKKPGRDPRAQFERPAFRDDVNTLDDLKKGMTLEGIVTNVTAFGAFVDIGVHQDGLVHISELSDRYVDDPSKVVRTGDKIKVRVLEVDVGKKRISLSAKQGERSERTERVPARGGQVKVAPSSSATLGSLSSFSRLKTR
jgi:uncharacterized protein